MEDALDDYAERIPFALEIKDPRAAVPLARLLAARGVRDGVTIRSFSWGALLDAQAIHSALPYGLLTMTLDDDLIARSVRRGFTQVYPHVDRLTARRVTLAHEHGLCVFAWGSDAAIRSSASLRPARTARVATGPTESR